MRPILINPDQSCPGNGRNSLAIAIARLAKRTLHMPVLLVHFICLSFSLCLEVRQVNLLCQGTAETQSNRKQGPKLQTPHLRLLGSSSVVCTHHHHHCPHHKPLEVAEQNRHVSNNQSHRLPGSSRPGFPVLEDRRRDQIGNWCSLIIRRANTQALKILTSSNKEAGALLFRDGNLADPLSAP